MKRAIKLVKFFVYLFDKQTFTFNIFFQKVRLILKNFLFFCKISLQQDEVRKIENEQNVKLCSPINVVFRAVSLIFWWMPFAFSFQLFAWFHFALLSFFTFKIESSEQEKGLNKVTKWHILMTEPVKHAINNQSLDSCSSVTVHEMSFVFLNLNSFPLSWIEIFQLCLCSTDLVCYLIS